MISFRGVSSFLSRFRISVIFQPGRCANLFKNGCPVFAPPRRRRVHGVNFAGSRASGIGTWSWLATSGAIWIFMCKVDHEGG